ncbi:MAG: S8 family serine peptidase [Flavobacteriales bacterium]
MSKNYWNTFLSLSILLSLSVVLRAQSTEFRFAVFFKDKGGINCNYSSESPLSYLSLRAIDRKFSQGIVIDSLDFPVHAEYRNQVLASSSNFKEAGLSRWLNCQLISCSDSLSINQLSQLPFVSSIECIYRGSSILKKQGKPTFSNPTLASTQEFDLNFAASGSVYGQAGIQNQMIACDYLHGSGFWGQGMLVAVLDGGFSGVQSMGAFSRAFSNGQMLGNWDFVEQDGDVYEDSQHGTYVLSCMAAWQPGAMVGTAPAASYVLFKTEHVAAETPMEEYYWVLGAEMADSLGANVLNASLGYTEYDAPFTSHSYLTLNGTTAPASRGAETAASKGLWIVNSAGNSGNKPWKYVGVPADARSIFAVGAVQADRSYAAFSSQGPSVDGRVKPELCAMGRNSTVMNAAGISTANGTSFSAPIFAGALTSFLSMHKEATPNELRQAVLKSCHQYLQPDEKLGYGIPHFGRASVLMNQQASTGLRIVPNPVQSGILRLIVEAPQADSVSITVRNSSGMEVIRENRSIGLKGPTALALNLQKKDLPSGVYWLQIQGSSGIWAEAKWVNP